MRKRICVAGVVAVALLSCAFAQNPIDAGQGRDDTQIKAEVTRALENRRFKDVQSAVHNGIVTLTGTVDVYSAKTDAGNRVHRRRNVRGVENLIQVVGPTVDDETLRNK